MAFPDVGERAIIGASNESAQPFSAGDAKSPYPERWIPY
jgi:hypothetical protein